MSELKAVHAFDVYEAYTKTGDDDAAQVYIKSEADNIISTIRAERDEYRYNLSCARNEIHNLSMSMREDVKRLADKDKVIAEKYKEIAELKERIDDGDKDFEMANHQNERLLQIVCHQKYKRCLTMTMWCRFKRLDAADYRIPREKWEFYDKWNKRWLELAERFK